MALHAYTYALGHYVTAKYWHLVEPDGLHFTISETGWGKAQGDTRRRRARRGVSAAPDPVRGQVVKATIKLVKGKEGTEELKKEIQDYVKTHTAPYKYPRIVVFRDELPKTVSGKIQRNLL